MKKIKTIIITHGDFVNNLIKTCELFSGTLIDTFGISVQLGDTIEKVTSQIDEIIVNNKNTEFVVCVDIFGGTPFNAACLSKRNNDNILIITGVNLPILLFLSLEKGAYSTINEMKETLMSVVESSIKFF